MMAEIPHRAFATENFEVDDLLVVRFGHDGDPIGALHFNPEKHEKPDGKVIMPATKGSVVFYLENWRASQHVIDLGDAPDKPYYMKAGE